MLAAVAAVFQPHLFAGRAGKGSDHVRADRVVAVAVQRSLSAFGVGPGLVSNRLESGDPFFQSRVVEIGQAGFDGVIKPVEALFGFGDSPMEFGKVFAAALGPFLATVEDTGHVWPTEQAPFASPCVFNVHALSVGL